MITKNESHPKLAKEFDIPSLIFKREDTHPYGSHKGRSIPVMIDTYIELGFTHFAISSSGNSALAASLHIKKINREKIDGNKVMLEVFVGKNIKSHKLEKIELLKDENVLVSIQERPLQTLFLKTQDEKIKGLRQSTDDTALVGYEALAKELLEIVDLKAVFIGTSSGTTAQALAEHFIKEKRNVEVHIVQTSSCHAIANEFVNSDGNDEVSIADAIVDHTALRKKNLIPLLEKTGGNGWIAQNDQIKIAQELSQKYADVTISANSALSVAGLMEASYTGRKWDGTVVCMICGE